MNGEKQKNRKTQLRAMRRKIRAKVIERGFTAEAWNALINVPLHYSLLNEKMNCPTLRDIVAVEAVVLFRVLAQIIGEDLAKELDAIDPTAGELKL